MYTLYTVPLSLASQFASQEASELGTIFPKLGEWSDQFGIEVTGLLSGLLTALIWSTFFAVCPIIFKVSPVHEPETYFH